MTVCPGPELPFGDVHHVVPAPGRPAGVLLIKGGDRLGE